MRPLATASLGSHNRKVQREPIIYREEVTAILGVLADLNVRLRQIHELLVEEFGGEEEANGNGS
jgi:hypothetical protein